MIKVKFKEGYKSGWAGRATNVSNEFYEKNKQHLELIGDDYVPEVKEVEVNSGNSILSNDVAEKKVKHAKKVSKKASKKVAKKA